MTFFEKTSKLSKPSNIEQEDSILNNQDNNYRERFMSKDGISSNYGFYKTEKEACNELSKFIDIGYEDRLIDIEPYFNFRFNINKYFDYPVLFWLKDLIKDNSQVLDFGGKLGEHFYAYQNYISFPENLKWIVLELPKIIEAGEKLRNLRNEPRLAFIDENHSPKNFDVMLASGVIQYVDKKFLESLFENNYEHIIINRLPLNKSNEFITIQNVGGAFAFHYIYNKDEFIKFIEAKGFKLIDEWEETFDSIIINPKVERKLISCLRYYGFYFKKFVL